VEICDPSEDAQYAYHVNDILVSDFFTPNFYDPVKSAGVRYSYTGAITAPRQVLNNGYISWHDPVSDHWWQLTFFNGTQNFRDLGVFGKLNISFREHINNLTPNPIYKGLDVNNTELQLVNAKKAASDKSAASKAESWQKQIEELLKSELS
jgi:hypothetical protein